MTDTTFDQTALKKELKIHAKALGIPSGSAEIFIDHALSATQKSLVHKKIVTKNDVTRAIVKELKKYHKDFAYVYENHDKII